MFDIFPPRTEYHLYLRFCLVLSFFYDFSIMYFFIPISYSPGGVMFLFGRKKTNQIKIKEHF